MKQLIIEFITENNSPDCINEAKIKYNDYLEKLLNKYRFVCSGQKIVFTTQRILFILQLEKSHQQGGSEEVRGPEKNISFDQQGNPTYIYKKFLKQKSCPQSKIIIKKYGEKEYLFLQNTIESKHIKELVENFVNDLYTGLNLARKTTNILVITEHQVLTLNIGKFITSSNTFVCNEHFNVMDINDYFELLSRHQIELDEAKRKANILEQVNKIEIELENVAFYKSLDTLAYLSEKPRVYISTVKEGLLKLPEDILRFFLDGNHRVIFFKKNNQVTNSLGLLLDEDIPEHIINNYIKSIEENLLIYNKLYLQDIEEDFSRSTDNLKNTVFLEDLGTMFDKAQRVKLISIKISDLLSIGEPISSYTARAAELSKTDLTNSLVVVHPRLHGIVGKHYALKWGEKQEVAQAISEYLLPLKMRPDLPQTMAGSILSIADKIDTIVGLFSLELVNKSSDDPYKIKAKADGIIRIIERSQMDISLKRITNLSINLYETFHILKQQDKEKILKNILGFFSKRIYKYLEKQNFPSPLIEALLGNNSTNITLIMGKGEFMSKILNSREINEVTIAYNRLKNLIKGNEHGEIQLEFLTEDQEKKFYENFHYLKKHYNDKIDRGDFESAFHDLVSLSYEIEKFLNHIYVHTTDEALRVNRINMLFNAYELYYDFCDFSRLRNYQKHLV